MLLTKGNVKLHVAFDGTIINPFVVDGTCDLYYKKNIEPVVVPDGDGDAYLATEEVVLADYVKYRVNSRYGVMHRETGEIVLPAIYQDIDMISSTLIKAQLSGTYNYVVFDTQGRRVH